MNGKDVLARVVTRVHAAAYRVSGGTWGGRLAGMPVLLLTTRGRTTGRRRTTPLTCFPRADGSIVLVASYGGDARDPAWYRNLRADPEVEVRQGRERRRMQARTATAHEKERLWPEIVATYDGYRRYQQRTDRDIPLVVLTPR